MQQRRFSGRSWWPSHHPWTEPPSRGLCRNCFSRGMDVSPSFSTTSFTVRYLDRLGDAVSHDDDGRYQLTDRVFALWLSWRRPGGSVVTHDVGRRRSRASCGPAPGQPRLRSRVSVTGLPLHSIFWLSVTAHLGVQVKRSSLISDFRPRRNGCNSHTDSVIGPTAYRHDIVESRNLRLVGLCEQGPGSLEAIALHESRKDRMAWPPCWPHRIPDLFMRCVARVLHAAS